MAVGLKIVFSSEKMSVTRRIRVNLLRMGRLPEAWFAPPPIRELRELVGASGQTGRAALKYEMPGARGAGRRGSGGDDRPVWCWRAGLAGRVTLTRPCRARIDSARRFAASGMTPTPSPARPQAGEVRQGDCALSDRPAHPGPPTYHDPMQHATNARLLRFWGPVSG